MIGSVDPTLLRGAVLDAMRQEDVVRAVEAVYEQVGREVDARKPKCDISGRCCRFDDYGHLLFVTTGELAVFLKRGGAIAEGKDPGACPYQVNRLCTVHKIRPFGCRIYYCDPTATEWQQDLYERMHAKLKKIHEDLEIPYFYVEWRAALRSIQPPASTP